MSKLLNHSLNRILICAAIVLACSIPIYYYAISRLWQYEMDEHNVVLTKEAGREDSLMIIGAVTLLSVVFFALLLGALILMNRGLSKRMWQPFYHSLEQIRSFNLDKATPLSFETTGITEFDELNTSLKKLLSANLEVYNQQKDFADNASHELQTPLAIVRSKLELLLQNKRLDDDQYQLIEAAQEALSRAGRINKNLLLLTKIENSQFAGLEEIDFSVMVRQMLSQFMELSEDKGLEWSVNITENIIVKGNKTLLEILAGNLLNNAIRYTAGGGRIRVFLSDEYFQVSNTGDVPLLAHQLFKRFAITTVNATGTGLGLALIKQICDRYKWTVGYQFEDGSHKFQVQFLPS